MSVIRSVSLIALASCAQVYGAGFQVNENSAFLQGMAMAGSGASPNDVTSIFNNPAALGFINKSQVYMGATAVLPHVDMSDATAKHDTGVTGATSQNNIVKKALVPEMYAAYRASDVVTFGLSITSPFGMTSEYNNDSVVRFMAQKTQLITVNMAPMAAVKVTNKLSIALGLQIQYMDSEFSNYNGSSGASPATNPTDLKMNGWGVGYMAGVMYQPFDSTYLGLSYRSQVNTNLSGDGVVYTGPGGINPGVNDPTSASTSIDTPAVLNLSATQYLTKNWDVRATVQYTFWNSFGAIDIATPGSALAKNTHINYDWHNSWFVALGTNYHITDKWAVRTGVSYDQTPTPDATRDARIPDASRITAAVGTSYELIKNLRIDLAYEHIFMLKTSINVTQTVGSGGAAETNTVTANYGGSADMIALGLNYQF